MASFCQIFDEVRLANSLPKFVSPNCDQGLTPSWQQ
jgi:hypothetical protein